ncbi:MAG: PA0069 family radical SAM protein [Gemmatales bacterium]|nr:PA0069 family radical SAM protein [Gemmatales bacterium]MDW8386980.1 PA0069 family radical SAM protein [Gemmatales bacterium]
MRRELPILGRGAETNPPNRFEPLRYELDQEAWSDEEAPSPRTEFLVDSSRSIITYNDSPDVGFSAGVNPYRGCEHGCAYCYARPYHEYLGFSAGLDFESKILVKTEAPELLRKELLSPKWQPQVLGMSGVTDCYQPIERHLKLIRRCLEVLVEFRNPVAIVTKNRLVARDVDLLAELAKVRAAAVFISLTTLDESLRRRLEPRTSSVAGRLEAIRTLKQAGVPVGVMIAPVIPALNDHEIPRLLEAAVQAGAGFCGWTMLRLPLGVADLFSAWLERHFPERKDKVLARIREVRGGRLNDSRFGSRMRGQGVIAETIRRMFQLHRDRLGLPSGMPALSTAAFRRPTPSQPTLFPLS